MNSKYIVVDKSILPDYFEKVIEAKRSIEKDDSISTAEAATDAGISRSTYYKYKDHIFAFNQSSLLKRVTVSMMLDHEPGILSGILEILKKYSYSVWTINQNPPVDDLAIVVVTAEAEDSAVPVDVLIGEMRNKRGVHRLRLIGVE